MRSIDDNLQAVRQRITRAAAAVGRDPDSVMLLAVSKTHSASLVEQARAAGQRAFGENYVQEAVEKMDLLAGKGIEWHLVGPLQSNKTRMVAERFDWVHSVESEKILRRGRFLRSRERSRHCLDCDCAGSWRCRSPERTWPAIGN